MWAYRFWPCTRRDFCVSFLHLALLLLLHLSACSPTVYPALSWFLQPPSHTLTAHATQATSTARSVLGKSCRSIKFEARCLAIPSDTLLSPTVLCGALFFLLFLRAETTGSHTVCFAKQRRVARSANAL